MIARAELLGDLCPASCEEPKTKQQTNELAALADPLESHEQLSLLSVDVRIPSTHLQEPAVMRGAKSPRGRPESATGADDAESQGRPQRGIQ